MPTLDRHKRPLRSLRLSVTDRCNLRCGYCMPEEHYTWLEQSGVLTFEEMTLLVDAFSQLGVDRVRITGGEPLLRRDLAKLVGLIASRDAIRDVALTTNGVLLDRHAQDLRDAGLDRVTVSLDTLDPATFHLLTRRNDLDKVRRGIDAAQSAFGTLKIDTVVMRGVNDRELVGLIEFGKTINAEVRFIEYMDVGGATRWNMDRVVSRAEILKTVTAAMGPATPCEKLDAAPADQYRLLDGTVFGIISSTTQPFCSTCDRSRITADGRWFTCLYARTGMDLMSPIRAGATADQMADTVRATWSQRTDRGAEDRLALRQSRGALADPEELRSDPHLEMHTRGG